MFNPSAINLKIVSPTNKGFTLVVTSTADKVDYKGKSFKIWEENRRRYIRDNITIPLEVRPTKHLVSLNTQEAVTAQKLIPTYQKGSVKLTHLDIRENYQSGEVVLIQSFKCFIEDREILQEILAVVPLLLLMGYSVSSLWRNGKQDPISKMNLPIPEKVVFDEPTQVRRVYLNPDKSFLEDRKKSYKINNFMEEVVVTTEEVVTGRFLRIPHITNAPIYFRE